MYMYVRLYMYVYILLHVHTYVYKMYRQTCTGTYMYNMRFTTFTLIHDVCTSTLYANVYIYMYMYVHTYVNSTQIVTASCDQGTYLRKYIYTYL